MKKRHLCTKFSFLFIFAIISLGFFIPVSRADTFTIGKKDFLLNGKPFVIRSGEMHAARIPRAYWKQRLEMLKAMGCNAVCCYLFWNFHEAQPGKFNFTGRADAATFCRLAQEVGLKVILRPGPYSCAEWNFGGFPWWLLKYKGLKVRTRDPRFLAAARRYLMAVGKHLAPLQITRGGPIIMVQVENEYGSFGHDKEYIGIIRDYLKEAGFNDVPLFTCDGPSQLKRDVRKDIFCVVNFGGNPVGGFKALRAIRPTGPLMCGEFYPGWFDHWGGKHHFGNTKAIVNNLKYMLDHRASFSIYMAHGGTSFAFTAGANAPSYRPQVTSYDYDAPISEAGWATPKFYDIRKLFSQYLQPGETIPDVPKPTPVIAIPSVKLPMLCSIWRYMPRAIHDVNVRPMEMYNQADGIILYRTILPAGPAGKLIITEAHDWTQVFVNGKRVGILDRRKGDKELTIAKRSNDVQLDILVEAMGRINYGGQIFDHKGITKKVEWQQGKQKHELHNWEIFNMSLDAKYLSHLEFETARSKDHGPVFLRGYFNLKKTGDTFLNMEKWGKGVVWVNGHNLGRYWHIGPQQTLYLPGCWLKKGTNQITVLELEQDLNSKKGFIPQVQGITKPILNKQNLPPK